jgi:hypothetical protein
LIPTILSILKAVLPVAAAIAAWASKNQTLVKVLVLAAASVWALNLALAANPIILIVTLVLALAAALVWVATKTRFFQTVWGAVWDFLKGIGHWFANDFVGFFKGAWHAIQDAAAAAARFFVGIFKKINDVVMGVLGAIIHGAADAFGWVPGIGGKLKDAAKHFDEFRDRVNGALNKILDQDAHVRVHVDVLGVSRTAANKIMAGTMAGIRFNQAGGFVPPFGWSWVGEGGPELIRAGASGAVVASHNTSMGMAGGGAGVHFHFHGSVITSRQAAEDLVYEAYTNLVRRRRIRPVVAT